MNDDFLRRLRVQPPLEFTNRLAAKLQVSVSTTRSAPTLHIRRGWPIYVLFAGTALAAASPGIRAIVSHTWNSLFANYSSALPSESREAVLARKPRSGNEDAPAAHVQAATEPSLGDNLAQSPANGNGGAAQPVPSPPNSELNSSRPDVPSAPNMNCGDGDSEHWDNCVGLGRYSNGNIYRGEFHHGLREGFGVIVVNAKGVSDHNNILSEDEPAIYAGEFRRGLLNGHGVWFTKSGAGYSGTFIDNIPQPDVSQKNCSGALSLSWNNCVARISYENGNIYYGEFMDGRREGIGMLEIHETGTSDETSIRTPAPGVYVGQFSGGRLNGRGMIFMPRGGFYGKFTNNVLNGSAPGT